MPPSKNPPSKNSSSDQRNSSIVRKDLVILSTFLMFMMVIFGPFFVLGLGEGATLEGPATIIRQVGYLLITGLVFIALKPWENYRRLLAIPLPLMIGLAYCWLSLTWSIQPDIAFRRLILATVVMWTLFAAMRQLKFEEVLLLLRWSLVILLIANYVGVIVTPDVGIHTGNSFDEFSLAGDWRGIMGHKNFAGATTALALIVFAFDRGKMPRGLQWSVLVLAAYFLYRTNSKTSFGLSIAAIAAGYVFMKFSNKYRLAIIVVIAVLATGATIMEGLYQNPLAAKFSDPKAFTGRMQIWMALSNYIRDHPWFGAGYGSFWKIGPNSPIYQYATGEIANMPHGHNGFLDIIVQLGLPGFFVIMAVAVVWPLKTLVGSPIVQGDRGALISAIFIFCIGHNATETSLFERDMTVWVIFMVGIAISQPTLINYKRAKFDAHSIFRISRSRREGDRTMRRENSSG